MSAGATPQGDEENSGLITEINVTPMVDIMLVLLIIFMVTAQIIVSPAMKVELPRAAGKMAGGEPEPDVVVVVTREGEFQYQGRKISPDDLTPALSKAFAEKPNARLLIVADKKAYHGNVVNAMNIAKTVGFTRLGVAIDAAEPSR